MHEPVTTGDLKRLHLYLGHDLKNEFSCPPTQPRPTTITCSLPNQAGGNKQVKIYQHHSFIITAWNPMTGAANSKKLETWIAWFLLDKLKQPTDKIPRESINWSVTSSCQMWTQTHKLGTTQQINRGHVTYCIMEGNSQQSNNFDSKIMSRSFQGMELKNQWHKQKKNNN